MGIEWQPTGYGYHAKIGSVGDIRIFEDMDQGLFEIIIYFKGKRRLKNKYARLKWAKIVAEAEARRLLREGLEGLGDGD